MRCRPVSLHRFLAPALAGFLFLVPATALLAATDDTAASPAPATGGESKAEPKDQATGDESKASTKDPAKDAKAKKQKKVATSAPAAGATAAAKPGATKAPAKAPAAAAKPPKASSDKKVNTFEDSYSDPEKRPD